MADEKKTKTDKKLKRKGDREQRQFTRNNPIAGSLYNTFGGDRDVIRGAIGGYNLNSKIFDDVYQTRDVSPIDQVRAEAVGTVDPASLAATDAALQDSQNLRGMLPGVESDIQRNLGYLPGLENDVGLARRMIEESMKRDPIALEALSRTLQEQERARQIDPTLQGQIAEMMLRSKGYTPQERQTMIDQTRANLMQNQQGALADVAGILGARGIQGGAVAALRAQQAQDFTNKVDAAQRQIALEGIDRGDKMLTSATQQQGAAWDAAMNRVANYGTQYNNLLGNVMSSEAGKQQAATGYYGAATGALSDTNRTVSNLRTTGQNILQSAAQNSNEAAKVRGSLFSDATRNRQVEEQNQWSRNRADQAYNDQQLLQRALSLYSGIYQGAANATTSKQNNRAYDIAMENIRAQKDIANANVRAAQAAAGGVGV